MTLKQKKYVTNTKSINFYNLDRTIYGEYSTILDAAKSLKCVKKTIKRALYTKKGLVKRRWIVIDLSKKYKD